jgi:hypothetical protein
MLRISSMNFEGYEEIYRTIKTGLIKRNDQRYNYYLDAMPSHILEMPELTVLLGLEKSNIEAHTFISIYQKFLDVYKEKAHRDLRITEIVNHKVRRFCPECVKEHSGFKLHWQLNDIEVCEIHNIKLQRKCSYCNSEQPYLNKDTLIKGICFNCGHSLVTSHINKVADSDYIEKQKLLIRNYQYLINPNNILVNNINSLDREQSLALTLLYIMNGEKNQFNRNNINNSYSDSTVRRIVEISRGIKSSGNLTIRKFFEIFNELEIDISYMSKIKVPHEFLESLNHYYVIISDKAGNCLAPWCKSYKRDDSMKKVKRSKYFIGRNQYLKAFVCTSCYMKYGYRKKDAHWEAADNKIALIKDFVQYYPKETMIKKNREYFKISLELFYDLLGYSYNHQLLPKELTDKNSLVYSGNNLVADFEQLVQEGGKIFRKAQQKHKWTIGEYYYYFNSPDIQNYLHFDAHKEKLVDKISDFEVQVDYELNTCLENNVEITVNLIALKLNTTKKTLKRYGLSKKIMKVAEKQKLKMIKHEKRELYEKIKEFCNRKIKGKNPVLSKDLYQYIGVSSCYLITNHPDLYKFIINQVAIYKGRVRNIKLVQYKEEIRRAIKEIINQKEIALNQKNILNNLDLTDNIYRQFPELKEFIYEHMYKGA